MFVEQFDKIDRLKCGRLKRAIVINTWLNWLMWLRSINLQKKKKEINILQYGPYTNNNIPVYGF